MIKFKIGDKVKVLSGKDKGKEGVIEKVFPKKKTLVIPGINVFKKHVKGGLEGQKAGIFDVTKPVAFGKVAIICPKCSKITRVSFKLIGDEKKRICAKCDREITVKENKVRK